MARIRTFNMDEEDIPALVINHPSTGADKTWLLVNQKKKISLRAVRLAMGSLAKRS